MENTEAIKYKVETKVSLGEWSQDDFKNFLADFGVEKIEDIDWRKEEVRDKIKKYFFIEELYLFDEWEYKGKKYYFQQMAYLSEDCGDYYIYKATAEDDDRNIYEIEGESYPAEEIEGLEEEDFCDWENPVKITLLTETWEE